MVESGHRHVETRTGLKVNTQTCWDMDRVKSEHTDMLGHGQG